MTYDLDYAGGLEFLLILKGFHDKFTGTNILLTIGMYIISKD